MNKKLTDTQLVILSAASQRPDGSILPLTETITTNKGAATRVINGLLKQSLIAEIPVNAKGPFWRISEDDIRHGLKITNAGLESLGIAPGDEGKKKTRATVHENAPRKPKPIARPATKQSLLIDLLARKCGATLEEAIASTGWQAHSVRGAISGTLKKKLGLPVTSEMVDGRGRVYRISGQC